MTQEEKAKAYDKAVNKLKGFMTQGVDPLITRADVQDFFPELAESEDERIVKCLLNYFHHVRYNGLDLKGTDVDEVIAWLEKQNKENMIEALRMEYEKGKADALLELRKEWTSKDLLNMNEICEILDEYCRDDLVAWLEKQGEQKSTNNQFTPEQANILDKHIDKILEQKPSDKVEPKFHEGDIIKPKDGGHEPWQIIQVDMFNKKYRVKNGYIINFSQESDYELVEQIEPKYKVKDWVTNNIETVQITGYDIDYGYQVVDYKGILQHRDTDIIEKEYHLWTIQDAKDGDVLARNNDILSICIFSHFDGINNKYSSFLCHCGLEGEGLGQKLSINGYHDDSEGYVPATKEQRKLLFSKVKEAGYEWDSEKKEVKKVEQKTVEKVEPFDKYEGLTNFERTLIDICNGWIGGEELGWKQYIKDNADVLLKIAIKKLNSVQDVPFEQKPIIEIKSPEESLGISSKEYNEIVNDCLYDESKPANKVESENTPIEGKFPYNNSSDTLEDEIENIWGKLSCQGLFTATKEGFSEVATHFANYLKKQKPAKWSEEDYNKISSIKYLLHELDNHNFDDWLDSLKCKPQYNNSSWSEEDEKIYSRIYDLIHAAAYANYDVDEDGKELGEYAKIANWFKSIRSQSHWKPSVEQIRAIEDAIEFLGCTKKVREDLKFLYEQLKRLRRNSYETLDRKN